jgi:hypothetical protein
MSEIKNLAEALSKAQGEIKAPQKNRKVDYQPMRDGKPYGQRVKYSYAALADVIEAARIPLSKNNLCIVHQIVQNEKFYDLKTSLMHSSGESIETIYPLPDPTSVKPQEFGSALTYARRYSLSTLIGIASEEDDDGAEAPKPQAKQKPLIKPPEPPHDPVYNPESYFEPDESPQESPDDEPWQNLKPIEQILVLKHKIGLSNDEMSEVVMRVTGLKSTKECQPEALIKIVEYLKLKLK